MTTQEKIGIDELKSYDCKTKYKQRIRRNIIATTSKTTLGVLLTT